jgi:hypothetical protein
MAEPSDQSRLLFEFDDLTLMFVHTVAGAGGGSFSCSGWKECFAAESGRRQVIVFDRRGDWVKIKGADHPPQNGAVGWIKLPAELSEIDTVDDPAVRRELLKRIYGEAARNCFFSDDRIVVRALEVRREGPQLWAKLKFDEQHCLAKTDLLKNGTWAPVYTSNGDLQIFFNTVRPLSGD